MSHRILDQYSKLDVSQSAPEPNQPPNSTDANPSTQSPVSNDRHRQPHYHLFHPLFYGLSWLVCLGIVCLVLWLKGIGFVATQKLFKDPNLFFGLWILAFALLVGIHSIVLVLETVQKTTHQRWFAGTGFTAKLVFIGIVDFCLSLGLFGVLFLILRGLL